MFTRTGHSSFFRFPLPLVRQSYETYARPYKWFSMPFAILVIFGDSKDISLISYGLIESPATKFVFSSGSITETFAFLPQISPSQAGNSRDWFFSSCRFHTGKQLQLQSHALRESRALYLQRPALQAHYAAYSISAVPEESAGKSERVYPEHREGSSPASRPQAQGS